MINIHSVNETYIMLQGDYAMPKVFKTTDEKAKPFLVRLPASNVRQAYERYCRDNLRSMDAQSSMLIIRELTALGYLQSSKNTADVAIKRTKEMK